MRFQFPHCDMKLVVSRQPLLFIGFTDIYISVNIYFIHFIYIFTYILIYKKKIKNFHKRK